MRLLKSTKNNVERAYYCLQVRGLVVDHFHSRLKITIHTTLFYGSKKRHGRIRRKKAANRPHGVQDGALLVILKGIELFRVHSPDARRRGADGAEGRGNRKKDRVRKNGTSFTRWRQDGPLLSCQSQTWRNEDERGEHLAVEEQDSQFPSRQHAYRRFLTEPSSPSQWSVATQDRSNHTLQNNADEES